MGGGGYLLVVVSPPWAPEHKEPILQRVAKGLLSWDIKVTGADLTSAEKACLSVKVSAGPYNELLIQHSTETLALEVLLHPEVSTLRQCFKNMMMSGTVHKHVVHAGYAFAGSGDWILQDGVFGRKDMDAVLAQPEVQQVLKKQRRYKLHVHCAAEGAWTQPGISLNPPDIADSLAGTGPLLSCLDEVLSCPPLSTLLPASSVVGNIRFRRPTLYVFPGGQGDCALFGVSGFTLLVDGGFSRRPCFWEFVRHLDRLDALLVTRFNQSNVCGLAALAQRKTIERVYPQVGYVFCNASDSQASPSDEELKKDRDELLVSVVNQGFTFLNGVKQLGLNPQPCLRNPDPLILYHKVGQGTLEMYVLSPPPDSKEVTEFFIKWSSSFESGTDRPSIPLCDAASVCALLVWRPAQKTDTITRILFSGSAPQSKIFEGLRRLDHLGVLRSRVVTTEASLSLKRPEVSDKMTRASSMPPRMTSAKRVIGKSESPSRSPTRLDRSKQGKMSPASKSIEQIAKKQEDEEGDKKEARRPAKKVAKKVIADQGEKPVTQRVVRRAKSEGRARDKNAETESAKPSQKLTEDQVEEKPAEKTEPKRVPAKPKTKGAKEVTNKRAVEAKAGSGKVSETSKPKPKPAPTKPLPRETKQMSPASSASSSPKHGPSKTPARSIRGGIKPSRTTTATAVVEALQKDELTKRLAMEKDAKDGKLVEGAAMEKPVPAHGLKDEKNIPVTIPTHDGMKEVAQVAPSVQELRAEKDVFLSDDEISIQEKSDGKEKMQKERDISKETPAPIEAGPEKESFIEDTVGEKAAEDAENEPPKDTGRVSEIAEELKPEPLLAELSPARDKEEQAGDLKDVPEEIRADATEEAQSTAPVLEKHVLEEREYEPSPEPALTLPSDSLPSLEDELLAADGKPPLQDVGLRQTIDTESRLRALSSGQRTPDSLDTPREGQEVQPSMEKDVLDAMEKHMLVERQDGPEMRRKDSVDSIEGIVDIKRDDEDSGEVAQEESKVSKLQEVVSEPEVLKELPPKSVPAQTVIDGAERTAIGEVVDETKATVEVGKTVLPVTGEEEDNAPVPESPTVVQVEMAVETAAVAGIDVLLQSEAKEQVTLPEHLPTKPPTTAASLFQPVTKEEKPETDEHKQEPARETEAPQIERSLVVDEYSIARGEEPQKDISQDQGATPAEKTLIAAEAELQQPPPHVSKEHPLPEDDTLKSKYDAENIVDDKDIFGDVKPKQLDEATIDDTSETAKKESAKELPTDELTVDLETASTAKPDAAQGVEEYAVCDVIKEVQHGGQVVETSGEQEAKEGMPLKGEGKPTEEISAAITSEAIEPSTLPGQKQPQSLGEQVSSATPSVGAAKEELYARGMEEISPLQKAVVTETIEAAEEVRGGTTQDTVVKHAEEPADATCLGLSADMWKEDAKAPALIKEPETKERVETPVADLDLDKPADTEGTPGTVKDRTPKDDVHKVLSDVTISSDELEKFSPVATLAEETFSTRAQPEEELGKTMEEKDRPHPERSEQDVKYIEDDSARDHSLEATISAEVRTAETVGHVIATTTPLEFLRKEPEQASLVKKPAGGETEAHLESQPPEADLRDGKILEPLKEIEHVTEDRKLPATEVLESRAFEDTGAVIHDVPVASTADTEFDVKPEARVLEKAVEEGSTSDPEERDMTQQVEEKSVYKEGITVSADDDHYGSREKVSATSLDQKATAKEPQESIESIPPNEAHEALSLERKPSKPQSEEEIRKEENVESISIDYRQKEQRFVDKDLRQEDFALRDTDTISDKSADTKEPAEVRTELAAAISAKEPVEARVSVEEKHPEHDVTDTEHTSPTVGVLADGISPLQGDEGHDQAAVIEKQLPAATGGKTVQPEHFEPDLGEHDSGRPEESVGDIVSQAHVERDDRIEGSTKVTDVLVSAEEEPPIGGKEGPQTEKASHRERDTEPHVEHDSAPQEKVTLSGTSLEEKPVVPKLQESQGSMPRKDQQLAGEPLSPTRKPSKPQLEDEIIDDLKVAAGTIVREYAETEEPEAESLEDVNVSELEKVRPESLHKDPGQVIQTAKSAADQFKEFGTLPAAAAEEPSAVEDTLLASTQETVRVPAPLKERTGLQSTQAEEQTEQELLANIKEQLITEQFTESIVSDAPDEKLKKHEIPEGETPVAKEEPGADHTREVIHKPTPIEKPTDIALLVEMGGAPEICTAEGSTQQTKSTADQFKEFGTLPISAAEEPSAVEDTISAFRKETVGVPAPLKDRTGPQLTQPEEQTEQELIASLTEQLISEQLTESIVSDAPDEKLKKHEILEDETPLTKEEPGADHILEVIHKPTHLEKPTDIAGLVEMGGLAEICTAEGSIQQGIVDEKELMSPSDDVPPSIEELKEMLRQESAMKKLEAPQKETEVSVESFPEKTVEVHETHDQLSEEQYSEERKDSRELGGARDVETQAEDQDKTEQETRPASKGEAAIEYKDTGEHLEPFVAKQIGFSAAEQDAPKEPVCSISAKGVHGAHKDDQRKEVPSLVAETSKLSETEPLMPSTTRYEGHIHTDTTETIRDKVLKEKAASQASLEMPHEGTRELEAKGTPSAASAPLQPSEDTSSEIPADKEVEVFGAIGEPSKNLGDTHKEIEPKGLDEGISIKPEHEEAKQAASVDVSTFMPTQAVAENVLEEGTTMHTETQERRASKPTAVKEQPLESEMTTPAEPTKASADSVATVTADDGAQRKTVEAVLESSAESPQRASPYASVIESKKGEIADEGPEPKHTTEKDLPAEKREEEQTTKATKVLHSEAPEDERQEVLHEDVQRASDKEHPAEETAIGHLPEKSSTEPAEEYRLMHVDKDASPATLDSIAPDIVQQEPRVSLTEQLISEQLTEPTAKQVPDDNSALDQNISSIHLEKKIDAQEKDDAVEKFPSDVPRDAKDIVAPKAHVEESKCEGELPKEDEQMVTKTPQRQLSVEEPNELNGKSLEKVDYKVHKEPEESKSAPLEDKTLPDDRETETKFDEKRLLMPEATERQHLPEAGDKVGVVPQKELAGTTVELVGEAPAKDGSKGVIEELEPERKTDEISCSVPEIARKQHIQESELDLKDLEETVRELPKEHHDSQGTDNLIQDRVSGEQTDEELICRSKRSEKHDSPEIAETAEDAPRKKSEIQEFPVEPSDKIDGRRVPEEEASNAKVEEIVSSTPENVEKQHLADQAVEDVVRKAPVETTPQTELRHSASDEALTVEKKPEMEDITDRLEQDLSGTTGKDVCPAQEPRKGDEKESPHITAREKAVPELETRPQESEQLEMTKKGVVKTGSTLSDTADDDAKSEGADLLQEKSHISEIALGKTSLEDVSKLDTLKGDIEKTVVVETESVLQITSTKMQDLPEDEGKEPHEGKQPESQLTEEAEDTIKEKSEEHSPLSDTHLSRTDTVTVECTKHEVPSVEKLAPLSSPAKTPEKAEDTKDVDKTKGKAHRSPSSEKRPSVGEPMTLKDVDKPVQFEEELMETAHEPLLGASLDLVGKSKSTTVHETVRDATITPAPMPDQEEQPSPIQKDICTEEKGTVDEQMLIKTDKPTVAKENIDVVPKVETREDKQEKVDSLKATEEELGTKKPESDTTKFGTADALEEKQLISETLTTELSKAEVLVSEDRTASEAVVTVMERTDEGYLMEEKLEHDTYDRKTALGKVLTEEPTHPAMGVGATADIKELTDEQKHSDKVPCVTAAVEENIGELDDVLKCTLQEVRSEYTLGDEEVADEARMISPLHQVTAKDFSSRENAHSKESSERRTESSKLDDVDKISTTGQTSEMTDIHSRTDKLSHDRVGLTTVPGDLPTDEVNLPTRTSQQDSSRETWTEDVVGTKEPQFRRDADEAVERMLGKETTFRYTLTDTSVAEDQHYSSVTEPEKKKLPKTTDGSDVPGTGSSLQSQISETVHDALSDSVKLAPEDDVQLTTITTHVHEELPVTTVDTKPAVEDSHELLEGTQQTETGERVIGQKSKDDAEQLKNGKTPSGGFGRDTPEDDLRGNGLTTHTVSEDESSPATQARSLAKIIPPILAEIADEPVKDPAAPPGPTDLIPTAEFVLQQKRPSIEYESSITSVSEAESGTEGKPTQDIESHVQTKQVPTESTEEQQTGGKETSQPSSPDDSFPSSPVKKITTDHQRAQEKPSSRKTRSSAMISQGSSEAAISSEEEESQMKESHASYHPPTKAGPDVCASIPKSIETHTAEVHVHASLPEDTVYFDVDVVYEIHEEQADTSSRQATVSETDKHDETSSLKDSSDKQYHLDSSTEGADREPPREETLVLDETVGLGPTRSLIDAPTIKDQKEDVLVSKSRIERIGDVVEITSEICTELSSAPAVATERMSDQSQTSPLITCPPAQVQDTQDISKSVEPVPPVCPSTHSANDAEQLTEYSRNLDTAQDDRISVDSSYSVTSEEKSYTELERPSIRGSDTLVDPSILLAMSAEHFAALDVSNRKPTDIKDDLAEAGLPLHGGHSVSSDGDHSHDIATGLAAALRTELSCVIGASEIVEDSPVTEALSKAESGGKPAGAQVEHTQIQLNEPESVYFDVCIEQVVDPLTGRIFHESGSRQEEVIGAEPSDGPTQAVDTVKSEDSNVQGSSFKKSVLLEQSDEATFLETPVASESRDVLHSRVLQEIESVSSLEVHMEDRLPQANLEIHAYGESHKENMSPEAETVSTIASGLASSLATELMCMIPSEGLEEGISSIVARADSQDDGAKDDSCHTADRIETVSEISLPEHEGAEVSLKAGHPIAKILDAQETHDVPDGTMKTSTHETESIPVDTKEHEVQRAEELYYPHDDPSSKGKQAPLVSHDHSRGATETHDTSELTKEPHIAYALASALATELLCVAPESMSIQEDISDVVARTYPRDETGSSDTGIKATPSADPVSGAIDLTPTLLGELTHSEEPERGSKCIVDIPEPSARIEPAGEILRAKSPAPDLPELTTDISKQQVPGSLAVQDKPRIGDHPPKSDSPVQSSDHVPQSSPTVLTVTDEQSHGVMALAPEQAAEVAHMVPSDSTHTDRKTDISDVVARTSPSKVTAEPDHISVGSIVHPKSVTQTPLSTVNGTKHEGIDLHSGTYEKLRDSPISQPSSERDVSESARQEHHAESVQHDNGERQSISGIKAALPTELVCMTIAATEIKTETGKDISDVGGEVISHEETEEPSSLHTIAGTTLESLSQGHVEKQSIPHTQGADVDIVRGEHEADVKSSDHIEHTSTVLQEQLFHKHEKLAVAESVSEATTVASGTTPLPSNETDQEDDTCASRLAVSSTQHVTSDITCRPLPDETAKNVQFSHEQTGVPVADQSGTSLVAGLAAGLATELVCIPESAEHAQKKVLQTEKYSEHSLHLEEHRTATERTPDEQVTSHDLTEGGEPGSMTIVTRVYKTIRISVPSWIFSPTLRSHVVHTAYEKQPLEAMLRSSCTLSSDDVLSGQNVSYSTVRHISAVPSEVPSLEPSALSSSLPHCQEVSAAPECHTVDTRSSVHPLLSEDHHTVGASNLADFSDREQAMSDGQPRGKHAAVTTVHHTSDIEPEVIQRMSASSEGIFADPSLVRREGGQTTRYIVKTSSSTTVPDESTFQETDVSQDIRAVLGVTHEIASAGGDRSTKRMVVRPTVFREECVHPPEPFQIPPEDKAPPGYKTSIDDSGTTYYYRISKHAEEGELSPESQLSLREQDVEGVANITETSKLPGSPYRSIVVRQTVHTPKHTVQVTTYESGISEGDHAEVTSDDEILRHPSPPGSREFYSHIGSAETQLPPEGSDPETILRFMAAQTEMAAKHMLNRPVYAEEEEEEEEEDQSPAVEEQLCVQELRPDFAELVELSGGTTPSDPQSPRSPLDIRSRLSGEASTSVIQRSVVMEEAESCSPTPVSLVQKTVIYDIPTTDTYLSVDPRTQITEPSKSEKELTRSIMEGAGLTESLYLEHHCKWQEEKAEEPTSIQSQSSEHCATTELREDLPEGRDTGPTHSDDRRPTNGVSTFEVQKWDKPLGLPTPPDPPSVLHGRQPRVFHETSFTFGHVQQEDQPLGLPTPPDSSRSNDARKTQKATIPGDVVYVDLTYVPHHGDPQYCGVEFFNRVRARYYVLSGTSPSQDVLNALLEAKRSWGEPDVAVTVIPTYETDALCYWIALNQEALEEQKIDVAPSASRCTINLQNHETSCAAYRLEF